MAAFCATTLVFLIPLFIEYILNCIAFPLSAGADLSNFGYYDEELTAWVQNYFMEGIYLFSPYLYAFCGILLIGICAGFLGAFTVAFSAVVPVKFSVFLLLPVYVLLTFTNVIQVWCNEISTAWYHYLFLFDETEKSVLIFGVVVVLVVFTTAGLTMVGTRKDLM